MFEILQNKKLKKNKKWDQYMNNNFNLESSSHDGRVSAVFASSHTTSKL